MPDLEALSAFAGFVLGFAQRLLIYPGGLFALVVMLASRGLLDLRGLHPRHSGEIRSSEPHPQNAGGDQGVEPHGEQPIAGKAGPAYSPDWRWTVAVALSWTGWALLPLPGAASLAWNPDLLVVLGLLAGGGLADVAGRGRGVGGREAAGWGLLLAAALLWILAGGDGRGGAAVEAGGGPGVLLMAARGLAALSYLAGLTAVYGGRDLRLPGVAGWLQWLGWAGLPLALIPAGAAAGLTWPASSWLAEGWLGAAATGVALAAAAPAMRTKAALWTGAMLWRPAWALVALGLLALLLG